MHSSSNFQGKCYDLGGEGPSVSGRIEGKNKKGRSLRSIRKNECESGDSVTGLYNSQFFLPDS